MTEIAIRDVSNSNHKGFDVNQSRDQCRSSEDHFLKIFPYKSVGFCTKIFQNLKPNIRHSKNFCAGIE